MAAVTSATLAFLGTHAAGIGAAATLYGVGSSIDASNKQEKARAEQSQAIEKQKQTALTQRKSMIDKKRLQLLGAGDGKFKTKRTVGMSTSGTGEAEVLG